MKIWRTISVIALIMITGLYGNEGNGQNFLWASNYMPYNTCRNEGEGVELYSSDMVVITGFAFRRMYIATYSLAGAQVSTKEFFSNSSIVANDIAVGANCELYITGRYDGTATFDSLSLTSNVVHDVFILKTDTLYNTVWVKSLGGPDYDQGQKIVTDDAGNIYVAGEMEGRFYFDSTYMQTKGKEDIFFAKYSPEGHLCWIKQLGGQESDNLGSLKYSNGYLYLTGFIDGTAWFDTITVVNDKRNVFTARFNLDGHALWVKRSSQAVPSYFGGRSSALAVNDQGEIFTAGSIYSTLIFGEDTLMPVNPYIGVFIAKYDSSGNNLGARVVGGLNCNGAGISSDGGLFLTGYFEYFTVFGSDTLWSYVMTYPAENVYIAKLTADLDYVWAVRCGADGYMQSTDIALDHNDNIYVTGSYESMANWVYFYPYTLWGGQGQATFLTKLHDNCVGDERSPSILMYQYPREMDLKSNTSTYWQNPLPRPSGRGWKDLTNKGFSPN